MEQTFDFQTIVTRAGTGNMKELMTPDILKEQGIPGFQAAEMDFKTAPSVIKAMKACAENGLLGFTLCDQLYLNAVIWWMEAQRKVKVKQDWIVPTHGMIYSLATCIRMVVGEGENIIIQTPVYNRYKQAADRIGRGTVINPLIHHDDGSYAIDFDDLEVKMAKKENKLLVLCNPHNPLGRVWPKEDLEKIAKLAVKYNVLVYSDEIFADYTFDEAEVVPYFSVNGGNNNGITATSLGKTFNFTGVNHGNMIISNQVLREKFIKQKYSDHYGSIDPMHRAAILGAYCEDGAAWKDAVQDLIWKNYQTIKAFFAAHLPEVKISPLEGGYVIWIDWRGLNLSEAELKTLFEEKAMLILDDGRDYCIDESGFFRMSIATPEFVIEDALARLEKALHDEA